MTTKTTKITVAPQQVRTMTMQQLRDLIWPAQPDTPFEVFSTDHKAAFAQLIAALWALPNDTALPQLQANADVLGMELIPAQIDDANIWILKDVEIQRKGRGVYLFQRPTVRSVAVSTDLLLQAPHVYFDGGTGYIALAGAITEFAKGRCRAMFANTAHRYWQTDARKSKRVTNPADPSQNDDHPLVVASAAVIAGSNVSIVQIHGFDQDLDRGDDDTEGPSQGASREFDAIVSAGDKSTRTSSLLRSELGWNTARFPEDVSELGGTKNVIGQRCRSAECAFVHIEIAATRRDQLKSNKAESSAFITLIVDAITSTANIPELK
jgi:hypothetical protein